MKKLLLLLVCFGLLVSCEDVINVDLNESAPRLVIDASLNVLEDGSASAIVKLSTTTGFFDNVIPSVDDAQVTIIAEDGTPFPFIFTTNGIYTSDLIPQPDTDYTLEVIYQGDTYSATQRLVSSVPFDFVEQKDDGGFSGEDIELKIYFTDPAGVDNYYFIEVLSEQNDDDRDTTSDEFFDGNQIFAFYTNEDIEPGDEFLFKQYGVDKQFYNFMLVLLQQGSDQGGGPFQTQPATVRGNIVNQDDPDNFPLGYFRISEEYSLEYTVQ